MAATGQAMAYRCEQCGSSEIVALSQLYEQGARSFSAETTRLSTRMLRVGISYILLCLMVCSRYECAASAPESDPFLCRYGRCPFVIWPYVRLRVAVQFLQDRPFQPRGLPAPSFGLGAHFHVPPLREVFSDSSVAIGARSLSDFASNAQ